MPAFNRLKRCSEVECQSGRFWRTSTSVSGHFAGARRAERPPPLSVPKSRRDIALHCLGASQMLQQKWEAFAVPIPELLVIAAVS